MRSTGASVVIYSILGHSLANVMHITGATTGGNARFQFITHDNRRARNNRDDDALLDELLQVRLLPLPK